MNDTLAVRATEILRIAADREKQGFTALILASRIPEQLKSMFLGSCSDDERSEAAYGILTNALFQVASNVKQTSDDRVVDNEESVAELFAALCLSIMTVLDGLAYRHVNPAALRGVQKALIPITVHLVHNPDVLNKTIRDTSCFALSRLTQVYTIFLQLNAPFV